MGTIFELVTQTGGKKSRIFSNCFRKPGAMKGACWDRAIGAERLFHVERYADFSLVSSLLC